MHSIDMTHPADGAVYLPLMRLSREVKVASALSDEPSRSLIIFMLNLAKVNIWLRGPIYFGNIYIHIVELTVQPYSAG